MAPRQSQRFADYGTILTLLLVWAFLILVSLVLLVLARFAIEPKSIDGTFVSSDEVAQTIALSSVPLLFATIFNEILFDRAWRRIAYLALSTNGLELDNARLASHLRASNFELWTFLVRNLKGRISSREWRSFISYALLRWGTTASMASAQLSVSWNAYGGDTYIANKRHIFIIVPTLLHATCIFGAVILWRQPLIFFSDRFSDHGLLTQYTPYLRRAYGSLATYEQIAKQLESSPADARRWIHVCQVDVRSGRQVGAKLKGLWYLIVMGVPPALAAVLAGSNEVFTRSGYRYAFNLAFLAQHVFYVMALDFATWNITLDGFTRTPKAKPNRTLRYLGYSSGTMQFVKAWTQRRPARAAMFLWLFWIQSVLMRLLVILYAMCVSVLSYGNLRTFHAAFEPSFWLAWGVITAVLIFPLFFAWLVKKVEAPICGVDGWRWAQIAQDALMGEGYYGVLGNQAKWDVQVQPFGQYVGQALY